MKIVRWNEEKNTKLKLIRKISFEDVEEEEAQYEAVDYVVIENQEEEKAKFKSIIEANVKQKKSINIRPLEADIIKIKSKALSKGIPYQTLINSIIHQFANDKLIEA